MSDQTHVEIVWLHDGIGFQSFIESIHATEEMLRMMTYSISKYESMGVVKETKDQKEFSENGSVSE